MEVIKIVLKAGCELPESCRECFLSRLALKKGGIFDVKCSLTQKYTKTKQIPSWCPLQLEAVCEWVHKFYDTYKSSCQESIVSQSSFVYCPTCGKRIKRIKYVEVE